MIRNIFILFALAFSQLVNAQFMEIEDPDGFVNIREEPNAKSKIIGKAISKDLVYHLESDENHGNWVPIIYNQNNQEIYGYIHNSRLKKINQYIHIPLLNIENNVWDFKSEEDKNLKSTITLKVEFEDASTRNLKTDANGNITLNNEYVWGIYDSKMKSKKYKSIRINFGETEVSIPFKEFETLFSVAFNPEYDQEIPMKVYYDHKKDILYINALNGDASYAYDLLFIIEKGSFKKRIVQIPF